MEEQLDFNYIVQRLKEAEGLEEIIIFDLEKNHEIKAIEISSLKSQNSELLKKSFHDVKALFQKDADMQEAYFEEKASSYFFYRKENLLLTLYFTNLSSYGFCKYVVPFLIKKEIDNTPSKVQSVQSVVQEEKLVNIFKNLSKLEEIKKFLA